MRVTVWLNWEINSSFYHFVCKWFCCGSVGYGFDKILDFFFHFLKFKPSLLFCDFGFVVQRFYLQGCKFSAKNPEFQDVLVNSLYKRIGKYPFSGFFKHFRIFLTMVTYILVVIKFLSLFRALQIVSSTKIQINQYW